MEDASTAAKNDFPALAGDLYARWTLDCLAEIAYAISNDAISRPQLYQSDDIPDDLVALRMSYGTVPHLPNSTQRQAMVTPILGPSDGSGAGTTTGGQSWFHIARRAFLDACASFAQQASDIERTILEDRVRSSAATVRGHFEGVRGKSFRQSAKQIDALFEVVIRVLRSPGVTRVFGIEHVHPEWPFNSVDPNGAKLVESVGVALSLSGACKLTFSDFLLLQRIAQEGSRAIHALLSAEALSDKELKSLIERGYVWGASLREMPRGSAYSAQQAWIAQARMSPPPVSPPPVEACPQPGS